MLGSKKDYDRNLSKLWSLMGVQTEERCSADLLQYQERGTKERLWDKGLSHYSVKSRFQGLMALVVLTKVQRRWGEWDIT